MKAKLILMVILMTVIPILGSAQTESGTGSAPTSPADAPDSLRDPGNTNVPAATASPAPEQVLQKYEAVMIAITRDFSRTLAGITQAVQEGKMSSEEAKNTSSEQYLMAQMQFQLLSAWRQLDEQDLAKVPAPDDENEASPANDDNEIVLVELPFSSFELTAAVAEHLNLTPAQKKAIQEVMTHERHLMEPLTAQSRSIKEKLVGLDPQHSNKKEIKTLADAQAALLARFIVANARMQSEIYKLLTPEQQSKLDDLKRSGGSETVTRR
jgi:hypothetical protein